jgi:hypothetical protein
LNNTVISKALAQSKVRKYRTQARNNDNSFVSEASNDLIVNQTVGEILNAHERKDSLNFAPNAGSINIVQKKVDSNILTVYRPKKGPKLNN